LDSQFTAERTATTAIRHTDTAGVYYVVHLQLHSSSAVIHALVWSNMNIHFFALEE